MIGSETEKGEEMVTGFFHISTPKENDTRCIVCGHEAPEEAYDPETGKYLDCKEQERGMSELIELVRE